MHVTLLKIEFACFLFFAYLCKKVIDMKKIVFFISLFFLMFCWIETYASCVSDTIPIPIHHPLPGGQPPSDPPKAPSPQSNVEVSYYSTTSQLCFSFYADLGETRIIVRQGSWVVEDENFCVVEGLELTLLLPLALEGVVIIYVLSENGDVYVGTIYI